MYLRTLQEVWFCHLHPLIQISYNNCYQFQFAKNRKRYSTVYELNSLLHFVSNDVYFMLWLEIVYSLDAFSMARFFLCFVIIEPRVESERSIAPVLAGKVSKVSTRSINASLTSDLHEV